jgi:hypothetical protein
MNSFKIGALEALCFSIKLLEEHDKEKAIEFMKDVIDYIHSEMANEFALKMRDLPDPYKQEAGDVQEITE